MDIFKNELLHIFLENDCLNIVLDTQNIKENNDINADIDHMLGAIENVYNSYNKLGKKMVLFFDTAKSDQFLPVNCIWKIAKFFSSKKSITANVVMASCVLTESQMIIKIINTFSLFYQNIRPMLFTKSREEAKEFLQKHLNMEKLEENKKLEDNNQLLEENHTEQDINNIISNITNE